MLVTFFYGSFTGAPIPRQSGMTIKKDEVAPKYEFLCGLRGARDGGGRRIRTYGGSPLNGFQVGIGVPYDGRKMPYPA